MLLFHGTRLELNVLLPGSCVAETHEEAAKRARLCLAVGVPRVYYLELDPTEVIFEGEIGYLVNDRKPLSWHRVGQ